MIRIELDEFSIDVPIEKRMTVQQFLAVADRLERISKRPRQHSEYEPEQAYESHDTIQHAGFSTSAHEAPHYETTHNAHDFAFEHESAARRTELLLERVNRRLDGLSDMQSRLERLEHRLDERR